MMRNKEDLKEMITNEKTLRFIARRFLVKGEYKRLEQELSLEEGSFDELFAENTGCEIAFQAAIMEEAEKERGIKSSFQVGKIIDRLFHITENPEEDAKTVNSAASIILNYYGKIQVAKKKGEEDEDDIDKLYKQAQEEKRNGKQEK